MFLYKLHCCWVKFKANFFSSLIIPIAPLPSLLFPSLLLNLAPPLSLSLSTFLFLLSYLNSPHLFLTHSISPSPYLLTSLYHSLLPPFPFLLHVPLFPSSLPFIFSFLLPFLLIPISLPPPTSSPLLSPHSYLPFSSPSPFSCGVKHLSCVTKLTCNQSIDVQD